MRRGRRNPRPGVLLKGDAKLILPTMDNVRRRHIDSYLKGNGIKVRDFLEIDTMAGALNLVKHSEWITILPAIAMSDEADMAFFSVRPITDPPLALDLIVIEQTSRKLSAASEAFLAVLGGEAAKLCARWQ
jgi:DNA-binding transcriptional LysR family regulator